MGQAVPVHRKRKKRQLVGNITRIEEDGVHQSVVKDQVGQQEELDEEAECVGDSSVLVEKEKPAKSSPEMKAPLAAKTLSDHLVQGHNRSNSSTDFSNDTVVLKSIMEQEVEQACKWKKNSLDQTSSHGSTSNIVCPKVVNVVDESQLDKDIENVVKRDQIWNLSLQKPPSLSLNHSSPSQKHVIFHHAFMSESEYHFLDYYANCGITLQYRMSRLSITSQNIFIEFDPEYHRATLPLTRVNLKDVADIVTTSNETSSNNLLISCEKYHEVVSPTKSSEVVRNTHFTIQLDNDTRPIILLKSLVGIYKNNTTSTHQTQHEISKLIDLHELNTQSQIQQFMHVHKIPIVFSAVVTRINLYYKDKGLLLLSDHAAYFHSFKDRIRDDPLSMFKYQDITRVMRKSWRGKDLALEIHFMNERSVFLAFTRDKYCSFCYKALQTIEHIAISSKTYTLQYYCRLWQYRMITNFEYIVQINHFSGRTFHDLDQYPIFPWLISESINADDFDSSNPIMYRDFNTPMKQLDTDPSNPTFREMLIAYLLLKNHSQLSAHKCLSLSPSLFGECIPQIYDLSSRGALTKDYVQLPIWASNNEELVLTMRATLENSIVTSQLHKWIDITFGIYSVFNQSKHQLKPVFENNHPAAILKSVVDATNALKKPGKTQLSDDHVDLEMIDSLTQKSIELQQSCFDLLELNSKLKEELVECEKKRNTIELKQQLAQVKKICDNETQTESSMWEYVNHTVLTPPSKTENPHHTAQAKASLAIARNKVQAIASTPIASGRNHVTSPGTTSNTSSRSTPIQSRYAQGVYSPIRAPIKSRSRPVFLP